MNRKQAKSLLAYGLLALVLVLASVVLVKAIASFSAGDSDLSISYNLVTQEKTGRAYTPQCLTDCHLPICITPSGSSLNSAIPFTDKDITQTLDFTQGADSSILKEIGVDYLTTETYAVDVPVYGTCQQQIYNNVTGQNETIIYECVTGSRQEQRTREVWKPLKDISQLNLEAGKEQCFDIWGRLQPKVNANFAVDVIPVLNLQNKEFSLSEYAWWLSNYSYARNNSVNSTVSTNVKNIPVAINGSEGFRNSTDREHAWCLLDNVPGGAVNTSVIFYYNSITDYRCVNNSDNSEFSIETEMGNGTVWTPSKARKLWNDANYTLVVHFNGTGNDSSGNFNTTGNLTYNNTGVVGKAAIFDSGDDNVTIGEIVESNNISFEFWVYLNHTPVSNQLIYDDYVSSVTRGGRGWEFGINTTQGVFLNIDASDCTGSGDIGWGKSKLSLNTWNYIVITMNNGTPSGNNGTGSFSVYENGTLASTITRCISGGAFTSVIGSTALTDGFKSGMIDEFRIVNKTLSADEVKARYQMLSPAFNWSRLTVEQTQPGYATESQGDSAILSGVALSVINASYTNYSDLQIYSRNVTGNQTKGRFDVVAVSGNQRWAFNYVTSNDNTSSYTYMVNITPVLYVWESGNKSATNITEEVKAFINSTKQS